MPSPSAHHRPSNRGRAKPTTSTRSKSVDIGEPLGPHDTNPVREKIRKWQYEGGGVVVTPDVGAGSDEENHTREPQREEARRDTRRARTRQRRGGTKAQKATEHRNEFNNSAPKKRVISDGHWRKNRSPPHSASTQTTPRKHAQGPNTKYDHAKSLFEEKVTEGSRDSSPVKSPKPQFDDGIKVYAGPLKSPQSSGGRDSREGHDQKSPEDRVDKDTKRHHRRRRRSSSEDQKVDKSRHHRPKDDKGPTKHDETDEDARQGDAPSPPKHHGRRVSPKQHDKHFPPRTPPKAGILDQVIGGSKKIFSKPEPETKPPERPHGARVEAWLSDTPDPFVEETPVEVPAPLGSSSRRRTPSKSDGSGSVARPKSREEDEEDACPRRSPRALKPRRELRSENDPQMSESSPRSRRGKSREADSPDPDSPGLRRSGARKRRSSTHGGAKMATLRESVEQALQESNLDGGCSSDGSEDSYMDRPPPLTLRRPFPSTGAHKLSTIASMDTLDESSTPAQQAPNRTTPSSTKSKSTIRPDQHNGMDSESRDHFDPDSLPGAALPSLKRRLTKHADLMSVLSIPGNDTQSIRSARSIRTNRSRLATATVSDLMRELESDEAKYMRELRTLVGGVIPVLLTAVLSKTDSAAAAGLFRPSSNRTDETTFTRPIVDMGVCLERLKTLHKRIPLNNPEALLTWAQSAHKVYAQYLKVWRLGFQDVVVNLAPPEEPDSSAQNSDAQSLWAGMSQDENGDVVDRDGERVDVAYLLKRPLVRLKYFSKTFKGLNYIQTSQKAEEASMTYQSLVTDARHRANEERSRVEDDTAAAIDATRCRDLQTLGVLENVSVDPAKRVRARDSFDLSLLHSTGQEVDCRSELVMRDNPAENGLGADLFICEADDKGRWLLFPPIDTGRVSARRGHERGQIVIMIREPLGQSEKWHELLSLKTEEEQIGFEWVELLGTKPVPPKINRTLSFANRMKRQETAVPSGRLGPLMSSSEADRVPSPTDINVPIGEKATSLAQRAPPVDRDSKIETAEYESSLDRDSSVAPPKTPTREKNSPRALRTPTRSQESRTPKSLNDAMKLAGGESPPPLKRTKAQRKSKPEVQGPRSPSPTGERTPERYYQKVPEASEPSKPAESAPQKPKTKSSPSPTDSPDRPPEQRPIAQVVNQRGRRSLSPVPSKELPIIPKVRKKDTHSTPPQSPTSSHGSESRTPRTRRRRDTVARDEDDWRANRESPYTEDVPAPPPHRTLATPSSKSDHSSSPVLSPPTPQYAHHRRTSSPLKHEYEPSTATESSLSETSTVERHDIYSSSETSEDELEGDDIATPLPPIGSNRINKGPSVSAPSVPADTIAPSNSPSEAPERTLPSQPLKAAQAIASIYYWHDKGSWEFIHSGECRIVVTPGLIAAYEMSSAGGESPSRRSSSGHSHPEGKPLVALELTPLVPIRRGTALDITIRSPPTEDSRMKTGSNIMFRSPSPDGCDKLYGLINQSRINNPTFIALQNAQGGQQPLPSRYNSSRGSKFGGLFSWYGGSSKSSYRASSAPSQSIGVSESSVGTMASAFSALKKFGAGSKMFNIARSTLTSRTGSRGGSLYSTSTRSGSNSSPSSGPTEGLTPAAGGIGLGNTKIRLYSRESASKWRDMGAARLTILPVSPRSSPPATPSRGNKAQSDDQAFQEDSEGVNEGATSPTAVPPPPLQNAAKSEKRILIQGKKNEKVLLDACLDESSFERVARTGIAVSVWEEFDEVAKEGGVVGGCFRVYMIQMKSEAETAYTFGLVGKLKY